jgi:hypothetical protein
LKIMIAEIVLSFRPVFIHSSDVRVLKTETLNFIQGTESSECPVEAHLPSFPLGANVGQLRSNCLYPDEGNGNRLWQMSRL